MFDTTGLIENKMRKKNGWQGVWYAHPDYPLTCIAKTCSTCHELLTSDRFGPFKKNRSGLQSMCITCKRTYDNSWNSVRSLDGGPTVGTLRARAKCAKNMARTDEQIEKDRLRKRPDGSKRCSTCREIYPLEEYTSDRRRGDGLDVHCKSCKSVKRADKRTKSYISYWANNDIPLRCYLCDGPYEEVEHIVPLASPYGLDIPSNTRPSCIQCNRGPGGKHDKPLEEYIFSVSHPTKARSQILYEIVMSGTWPFTNTTAEEFTSL